MQTIQADKELATYLKGRRDEAIATLEVLEILTRLGHLDLKTSGILIDFLAKIDKRRNK